MALDIHWESLIKASAGGYGTSFLFRECSAMAVSLVHLVMRTAKALARFRVPAISSAFLAVFLCGCVNEQGKSGVSSVEGSASGCRLRCAAVALRVACAELGADSEAMAAPGRYDSVGDLRELLNGMLTTPGSALQVVPFSHFVKNIDSHLGTPVVLVHESSHLYVLLGAVELGGDSYFQVLHGRAGPTAMLASEFAHQDFREAWVIPGGHDGVSMKVGDGLVRVDSLWKNLGEIRPFSRQETSFEITNLGETRILLGKPSASCGCTVAEVNDQREIGPGESTRVEVAVRSQGKSATRHSIWLKVLDQSTRNLQKLHLEVMGNQLETMEVTPRSLDFGTVGAQRSATRTVRLTEVKTDRFDLKQVDVGDLPLDYAIETNLAKDGLKTHRVDFVLDREGLHSGKHKGNVRLVTDSSLRPLVEIPVCYQVEPLCQLSPSLVSFGNVTASSTLEQSVNVTGPGPFRLTLTLARAPEDCRVSIDQLESSASVVVKPQFSGEGAWKRSILSVEFGDSVESLVLDCVAIVSAAE